MALTKSFAHESEESSSLDSPEAEVAFEYEWYLTLKRTEGRLDSQTGATLTWQVPEISSVWTG